MQEIITQLDAKFLEFFTQKELEEILEAASVYSKECIVIFTQKYFFELSADMGSKLELYYDHNYKNGVGGLLTKEEFLSLLRSDTIQKACIVSVKE